jgi:hypothetical protein
VAREMNSKANNAISKGEMCMSDEERRKLAEKLDQELDEFIGGLEKRSCTDEWPEDRWQEVRFYKPKLGNNTECLSSFIFCNIFKP